MEGRYPMIDRKKTGERIRALMDRKGLSVEDVQKHLYLGSPQTVYHWLSGRSLPNLDTLYALSELLGTSIDDILCGSKDSRIVTSDKEAGDDVNDYIRISNSEGAFRIEKGTMHRLFSYYEKIRMLSAS